MGAMHHTKVSLRILGDDLEPDEISRLLNVQPTEAGRKGEPRHGRPGATPRKTGAWFLRSGSVQPGDLDRQIAAILALTTTDPDSWRSIHARYQADLYAGLFMATRNDGLTLGPATLEAAARRGLELHLDVYDPEPDDCA